tara:strand:- start:841 stop:1233 length:393 start_codon:yes stop_codon:yes gene_type:complete
MVGLIEVPVIIIDHDNIHKRIPVVFDDFPVDAFSKLSVSNKLEYIRQFILGQPVENEEFIDIISNAYCFQQSTPTTESSRTKNITATVNANTNKRTLGIKDADDKDKDTSCWQAFIDKTDSKLCILWQKK